MTVKWPSGFSVEDSSDIKYISCSEYVFESGQRFPHLCAFLYLDGPSVS